MLDYLSKAKEEGKEIIVFGSSVGGKKAEKYLLDNSVVIDAFCDNNKDVWNQIVQNHPVISPIDLSKKDKVNTIIVIASNKYIDIEKQVKVLSLAKNSYGLVENASTLAEEDINIAYRIYKDEYYPWVTIPIVNI